MKRQVMQPFRAPRQHKEKASPSRQQKEKPFRAPLIIKETQYSDIDEMIEKDSNGKNGNGKQTVAFSIVARGERSAVALAKEAGSVSSVASPCRSESQSHSTTTIPSPNIKEFEDFLDNVMESRTSPPVLHTSSQGKRKKMSTNDQFWEGVLESEKRRLLTDSNNTLTPVDAMMVGASSDDDDVPIAQTLGPHSNGLSMLATLAGQPTPPQKAKQKKQKKSLWTYETVAEPTGASSRYWDADTPTERATKRRAKEKLLAIQETDGNAAGA